ncbi:MAG: erythromycin esterase family protein [Tissierellia bacterium]|nr:erythromycin esterase family protein [Tissierellia bacterium]
MKKTREKSILVILLATAILIIILFFIVLNLNLASTDYEYRQLALPDNFSMPDARVIAIGTATHGNAEPYDITIEMLQKMKEERGSVAFVLEELTGDGARINQIHSYYDDEQERPLGFYNVYNNSEMNRLLSWVKSEDVNLYGIDIQSIYQTVEVIKNFLNEKGYLDTNIDKLRSETDEEFEKQMIIENIESIMDELLKSKTIEEREFDYISHLIHCIQMNYEYVAGGEQYYVGDKMMAENVLWVMEHEMKYYDNENIILFAHSGHIIEDDFTMNFRDMLYINAENKDILYVTMGHHLSNYLGDDYYTIVTEAKNNSFLADSNLPNDKRKLFSIERKGSLIDAIGAESPSIKFCTSEYLKQAGISTWDLTLIGSYFNNINTFIPARFTINTNVETCFDAMLYFDQFTPNIDNRSYLDK